jgi:two-component system OmpR family sensor kinase
MTLWYAGLLATALLMFGSTVYLGLERHLDREMNESLVRQARTIGDEVLVTVAARGPQFAVTEIDESYEPEVNGRFIRVTREDGILLYRSSSPRDGGFDATQIPPAVGHDREGYKPRMVNAADRQVVLQGLHYQTSTGEGFLIETGAPYQLIAAQLRSARLALALGIPVFLVVAAAGGLVLVRNSLRPLREITQQAERISSENLSQRLPVARTGDEVERLALSLNRMIERLEESIQHISRFSADVSHELRTPLTILRGELETMAQQRSRDAESLEMIGNSLEEIDRLARIVDQLLIISRLDAGQAGMEREQVNLAELATSTAEQMRLLADEKKIAIHFSLEPTVNVAGDRLRLKQVLVNLLDNAIKYTAETGTIELIVREESGRARLGVADNGIGIASAEQPYVFDRFYRTDKARARATGGAGLGLSIVKAIVVAHEGRVSVVSIEGKGTTLWVELPMSADVASPRVAEIESRRDAEHMVGLRELRAGTEFLSPSAREKGSDRPS